MAESDCTNDIEKVVTGLSKSWEFLSGEQRVFRCVPQSHDALPVADFSFYIPLNLVESSRVGGVGVLIQQDDAIQVATNMFGVARQQIQHDDLRDACAEVCNVFTYCMATHFGGGQQVAIGLPREAGLAQYQNFAERCVTRAVYEGCAGERRLLVVLYDSLHLPTSS
jgi:hypothetical protein